MTLKPPATRTAGLPPLVRIIAPASSAQPARIAEGARVLAARGYRLSFGAHAEGRYPPYFAASAEARLADLHAAFADATVDLIMCTRGGYGSNYLLEELDLELIRSHPKPLFAYSDMTAVQTWLMDQTGLVAFHGPMLAADFYRAEGADLASFDAVLTGQLPAYSTAHGMRVLRPGDAQGILYGGCLSLLAASLGTPYAPHTEGKLLFLEDVGAKPYQVDRMLRQLRLAGKLDGVKGYIFGEMLDCTSPGAPPGLLEQAIFAALDGLAGPVAIGLRSGHVSRANVTLPLGLQARLTLPDEPGGAPWLRISEPAVLA